MDHLGEGGEPVGTPPTWPFFKDWMSVNGCEAEIMVGQHRVEAAKAFLRPKGGSQKVEGDPNEGSHWWICDIYDKGRPSVTTRKAIDRRC